MDRGGEDFRSPERDFIIKKRSTVRGELDESLGVAKKGKNEV